MNLSRLDQFSAHVESLLDDSGVEFKVGRKYLSQHKQQRRVIFTRSGQESWVETNPRNAGGQKFDENEQPKKTNDVAASGTETREIQGARRVEACEMHVYAEGEKELDDLFDALIAVFKKNPGLVSFQQDNGIRYTILERDGEAQRQPKLIATVYYYAPVATETKVLARVTSVTHTQVFDV